jgi:hypothetical protein
MQGDMYVPIRAATADADWGLNQITGCQETLFFLAELSAVVFKGLPMMHNAEDVIPDAVRARVTQTETASISRQVFHASAGVTVVQKTNRSDHQAKGTQSEDNPEAWHLHPEHMANAKLTGREQPPVPSPLKAG